MNVITLRWIFAACLVSQLNMLHFRWQSPNNSPASLSLPLSRQLLQLQHFKINIPIFQLQLTLVYGSRAQCPNAPLNEQRPPIVLPLSLSLSLIFPLSLSLFA